MNYWGLSILRFHPIPRNHLSRALPKSQSVTIPMVHKSQLKCRGDQHHVCLISLVSGHKRHFGLGSSPPRYSLLITHIYLSQSRAERSLGLIHSWLPKVFNDDQVQPPLPIANHEPLYFAVGFCYDFDPSRWNCIENSFGMFDKFYREWWFLDLWM